MKLEGDYRFEAPAREVWDALFDTDILAAALPGCEKLERTGDTLVGDMSIKVGPITAKLTGKVKLEDVVEPTSYKMNIDGRGPQGFVNATATIALAADGDEATILKYSADANIGGKIASVGARLLDASARAVTKQSLENLHTNIKIRVGAKRMAAIPRIDVEKPAVPDAASPPVPAEPPAPAPEYKRAQAGEMAKAVAKEVGKTLLPAILLGVVVIAGLIYFFVIR
jgi:uncharacterized protein